MSTISVIKLFYYVQVRLDFLFQHATKWFEKIITLSLVNVFLVSV